jgi:hypothetical protein
MAKTLFAVSTAALLVSFVAGWAVSDSQASVAKAATVQVDTFQMMTSAQLMPSERFADFSFVFN